MQKMTPLSLEFWMLIGHGGVTQWQIGPCLFWHMLRRRKVILASGRLMVNLRTRQVPNSGQPFMMRCTQAGHLYGQSNIRMRKQWKEQKVRCVRSWKYCPRFSESRTLTTALLPAHVPRDHKGGNVHDGKKQASRAAKRAQGEASFNLKDFGDGSCFPPVECGRIMLSNPS